MWLDIKIHKEARYYQPYLNGEKLKDCFAANEEEGWADIYDTDSEGHHIFTIEDNLGNILRESISPKCNFGEEAHLKKKRIFGKIELKKEYKVNN